MRRTIIVGRECKGCPMRSSNGECMIRNFDEVPPDRQKRGCLAIEEYEEWLEQVEEGEEDEIVARR